MQTLHSQRGGAGWLSLAAIIVLGAIAYFWAKPAHQGKEVEKPAAMVSAAPVASAAVAASAISAAPAMAVPAKAVILFAKGSDKLPTEAAATLADMVAYMKANASAKVVLSGYHDPKGNKAKNEVLAKNRAKAVRQALRDAGVAGVDDANIVMQKPAETALGGNPDEARRVEISIQ